MSLPPRLGRWLRRRLVQRARPCLIRVDREGRLLGMDGDCAHYGLDGLPAWADVTPYLPLLVGLDLNESGAGDPSRDVESVAGSMLWPMVEIAGGRHADLLLEADGDVTLMLLTDADDAHARQALPQQHANERALLTRRLQRALEELKAARSELEARNRMLESLNDAKGRFIAGLSHELRTPLTAVLGHAGLLRDQLEAAPVRGAASPSMDASRESLDAIQSGAEHLLSLVGNVLDHASIETGQLVMNPAPLSLAQLCVDLRGLFEREARRRGMTFRVRADRLPPRIETDATRLRQVIINLVNNALKYAGTGVVELKLDWREGRLVVAVADRGPGVPLSQRERILRPFERADTSSGEGKAGSVGLGLAISAELVRRLGGEIQIDDHPGGGALFSFSIAAPVSQGPVAPAGTAGVASATESVHLLMVDDAPEIRILYTSLLGRAGFSVRAVRDAEAALAALAGRRPGIIIVDLNLCDADGAELVRRFRAQGFAGKILGWSASALRADRERMLGAGADRYLVKPVPAAELRDALRELFVAP